jgi:hypothetical protein
MTQTEFKRRCEMPSSSLMGCLNEASWATVRVRRALMRLKFEQRPNDLDELFDRVIARRDSGPAAEQALALAVRASSNEHQESPSFAVASRMPNWPRSCSSDAQSSWHDDWIYSRG